MISYLLTDFGNQSSSRMRLFGRESCSGRNKFNADFSVGVKTAKKIIYTNSRLIYIQTKDGYFERSEIRLRQCRGLTDSLVISNFIRSLFFFKGGDINDLIFHRDEIAEEKVYRIFSAGKFNFNFFSFPVI